MTTQDYINAAKANAPLNPGRVTVALLSTNNDWTYHSRKDLSGAKQLAAKYLKSTVYPTKHAVILTNPVLSASSNLPIRWITTIVHNL